MTSIRPPEASGAEQVLWTATNGPQTIRAVLRATLEAQAELRIAFGDETLEAHVWARYDEGVVQDASMRALQRWISNGWRIVDAAGVE